MKTLIQQAKEIVTQGANRNPYYSDLNDAQREQLTAAAIEAIQPVNKKLAGVEIGNSEMIDEVVISKAFINKIIEALNEQNIADKNILLKELGEMLIKGAIKHCESDVTDAIDEAVLQLAKARHFYDDNYEVQRMIAADNAQRARDMQQGMRG